MGYLFLFEIYYPGVAEAPCERRDITDEALWVRNIFDADCRGLFIDGMAPAKASGVSSVTHLTPVP